MQKSIWLITRYFPIWLFLLFAHSSLFATPSLLLRSNLNQAHPGDYLVMSCNKTNTLLHIYGKQEDLLTIEEIVIAESKRKACPMSWKEWVAKEAPGHSSWSLYEINTKTGEMIRYYSFSKKGWFEIPDADNFLAKLLNLKLQKIPDHLRKRVGPSQSGPDFRPTWHPQLVVEGRVIKGVLFDAWQARWPKDNSELSGKLIELYLPQDHQRYPSYFPYWLQISGVAGKAKVRIIDSGFTLSSPKPPLSTLSH